jgi:hypothetical protein
MTLQITRGEARTDYRSGPIRPRLVPNVFLTRSRDPSESLHLVQWPSSADTPAATSETETAGNLLTRRLLS